MHLVNLKLYLLFVAVATGVLADSPDKFANEEYVTPAEMPYMVSLRTRGHHFCGGSIISYYHILTAAHCLDQTNYPTPFDLSKSYAVTASAMGFLNGTVHYLQWYLIHPSFTMDNPEYKFQYDIAILTVRNKMEMNEYRKIIRLPVSPVPRISAGISAGFGVIHFRDMRGSDFLKKVATTVMNGEECQKHRTYVQDPQTIICSLIHSKNRNGTCPADSGGPLVAVSTLVGIASADMECTTESPDVYTSVYFYKDWIQRNIQKVDFPRVTKDSDFYNKDKVKNVGMKY